MSWSTLPREIQLQIIISLDRPACKSLRLTNKFNAATVTPRLFSTVHLTPNTRSFERARHVAETPHLAKCVKALVYHVGVLDDVHDGFPSFRDDVMRLHRPIGSVDDITADILWKYNCFHEEMDGQREFEEERDEYEELSFLCARFKAVESLTTVLDEDDPFSPPQDFIGLRTGVHSPCAADGPHFSDLMNAAAGKSLSRIRGWSASWYCLPRIVQNSLQTIDMMKMKELSLNLFNSEILEMITEDRELALQALDDLLGASVSGEGYVLQLDFDEIPFDARGDELRPIAEVVFKHRWPSLQKLALEGIATTEDSLVSFFQAHSFSLKSLHLDDIEVLSEISYDVDGNKIALPGSVVMLFHRIRDALDIESLTLSGNFTNRHDESWYVNLEHDNENCLRRDIELWLLRKAPSPFPSELTDRKRQVNGSRPDPESAPDRPRASVAEEYSDGSWVWDL